MKKLFFAALVTCILPFAAVGLIISAPQTEILDQNREETGTAEEYTQYTLMLETEEGINEMELEEYVVCVVLAEMPADFESEALKAQAVVARTYTCQKMEHSKHTSFDVCMDYRCCQACCMPAEYIAAGGTEEAVEKIRRAVADTAGMVLTYEGAIIEATYFSCSGGKTEDACEVWGGEVPYLHSVESPGEEQAAHYLETVTFTVAEFSNKLDLALPADPSDWISNITYTKGGGIKTIQIGGREFTGTQIRQKLDLYSTAFVINLTGDRIVITTKGFGHRVGMSQYGAEAMAVQGNGFEEILYHYYTGAVLSTLSG